MKNTLEKEWSEYLKALAEAKKLIQKAKEIQQKVNLKTCVVPMPRTWMHIEIHLLSAQAFGLYVKADKIRNEALIKWLNSIIKKYGNIRVDTLFKGEIHEYDYLLETREVYKFQ